MAGPSRLPDKKQASISSFFTPRNTSPLVNLSQNASKKPPPAESKSSKSTSSRKRPEPQTDDSEDDVPRDAKRRRSNGPSAATDTEDAVASLKLSSSSRTERYALNSSRPSQDEQEKEEDVAERKKKEELHRKFVKKLGHPDSMFSYRQRDTESAAVEGEGEEGEDDEEEPAPKTTAKKKGAKTGKLTPMELQFLEIKRKHMDTLLIVEVGYKFRFFGEDARIAARELSIVCIPGKFRYDEHPSEAHLDRFASASIPVHRLPVHAKRLVAAGYKVGVVRQIETAALKKAGDNRNAPFVRKLTNVYTKGTYIDETGELDQPGETTGASSGGYLLCLTETPAKGMGTDEKVNVGIIAVQPATGDIIYDEFEDGFMRREIETRLLHISPCEFLIVGDLSKATDKLIQHLSGSSTNVFGDKSRVERVPKSKTMAAESYSNVTDFYAGKAKDSDERSAALLNKVLKLPEAVMICLSAMITHLTEYGLQHIFDLTKYFQSFSTRQHMLINGTTLESLEVYRNATDHSEKGSLLWALDKTHTRFGQRLLRKWIGRPLLDQQRLEERVSAVEELLNNQSTAKVDKLVNMLKSIKADLERSLIRIYYGKCTRPELLSTLQTLQKISFEYARVKSPADTGFSSTLLTSAIMTLPSISPMVTAHLSKINAEAARKDDKYAFFLEQHETEDISEHKLGIAAVEQDLDEHRSEAAKDLGKKVPVNYVTVAGIEYLIEVPNTDLKRVPASWAKISGTKKVSRFHTPTVLRLIAERDQHKESLASACDQAFSDLLSQIAGEYQPLRDAVSSLSTLDCLLSLSTVAALPGYTKPTFLPSSHPSFLSITEGRHPIAEHLLPNGYIPFTMSLGTLSSSASSPDPNPTSPSGKPALAQLITGPNMGGKSSYTRAVALLVLLAQIGSFVPATSMSLTLSDAIFTRMGARDNLFKGESTFMVEVSETAAILRQATPRSLVVLDELGRGTSTHDGRAIAGAVLEYVVRDVGCLMLFVTHYQDLAGVAEGLTVGEGEEKRRGVECVHMRFASNKSRTSMDDDAMEVDGDGDGQEGAGADKDEEEEITFLYDLAPGVAHRSYGLNVARLARIPRKVLEVAARKSSELEKEVRAKRIKGAMGLVGGVLYGGGAPGDQEEKLEQLVGLVEQL
ncbi:DNA mismatch repair protein msh-3 [Neurospora crassa]|uniref:DNA mismatch repair protein msh-3 n=1 Tax=Neurospora crassa (strain ATCC 24698 / 74-OR23-1A / CBS 708.71 / DSM 1257 / FGSC 987) TaxID=367110 RepID=MSH3_NEUCR|nr:DNA mismatch repair protein Msh3 [Neurospora crassa OR74A]Q7SD11.1 RecName: Full=DNA mismatch repair protein msh-3; AltName: Full=MutS protein homolog 3 [Neurospora crassa OR74A]EAA34638.1 DNA mismatch repair protein Msh3 [Neurospora crassa OR74A]KHE84509.1 DNA mismatch repair protein msh-3 [Neurospora crassa]|eukprot:XP_963874.1 DNA mismatch repair protein Msh3 [Neurospora crassa OR74A]